MADKQTSASSQAPSLFASGRGGTAADTSSGRILASLEGRGARAGAASNVSVVPGQPRSRWLWAIAALLLLGSVLWWVWMPAPPSPTQEPARPALGQRGGLVMAPISPSMPINPPEPTNSAAVIVDDAQSGAGSAWQAEPASSASPVNPLNALVPPADPAQADTSARLLALMQSDNATPVLTPPPTRGDTAALRASKPAGSGTPQPARTAPPRTEPGADSDAALLSALLSLGIHSPSASAASPAASFALRSLPGLDLAEQLGECRQLGFLRGEQCRLQVCAGQWGIAPECPTAQAAVTP